MTLRLSKKSETDQIQHLHRSRKCFTFISTDKMREALFKPVKSCCVLLSQRDSLCQFGKHFDPQKYMYFYCWLSENKYLKSLLKAEMQSAKKALWVSLVVSWNACSQHLCIREDSPNLNVGCRCVYTIEKSISEFDRRFNSSSSSPTCPIRADQTCRASIKLGTYAP
jgi:hypothetical protein